MGEDGEGKGILCLISTTAAVWAYQPWNTYTLPLNLFNCQSCPSARTNELRKCLRCLSLSSHLQKEWLWIFGLEYPKFPGHLQPAEGFQTAWPESMLLIPKLCLGNQERLRFWHGLQVLGWYAACCDPPVVLGALWWWQVPRTLMLLG